VQLTSPVGRSPGSKASPSAVSAGDAAPHVAKRRRQSGGGSSGSANASRPGAAAAGTFRGDEASLPSPQALAAERGAGGSGSARRK
jgi:hypothetical protein